jgi:hypothetical protein
MIDGYVVLTPLLLLPLLALVRFLGCTPFGSTPTNYPPTEPTLSAVPMQITQGVTSTLNWNVGDGNNGAIDQGIGSVPDSGSTVVTPSVTTTYTLTVTFPDASLQTSAATVTVIPVVTPPPPPTPIAYLQGAENTQTLNNSSIATAAFGAGTTAGNLIVVWIFSDSPTPEMVASVTDTAGNTYQKAIGPTAGVGTLAGFQQEIWYANNIKAGIGVIVTASFSGTFNGEKDIGAYEYSGANKIAPVDKTAAGTGTGVNASIGPVMTTAPGLIFAAAVFKSKGAAGPAPFRQRSSLQNNVVEDENTSGPVAAVASFTNTAEDWLGQMVTFK